MNRARQDIVEFGKALFAGILLALLLAGVRLVTGASFEIGSFTQIWLWISLVLWAGTFDQPGNSGQKSLLSLPLTGFVAVLALGSGILYHFTESTLLAWLFLGSLYAGLLRLSVALAAQAGFWQRLLGEGTCTLIAGLLPVCWVQIETRFSTEEFFAVIESAALMLFWLALRGAHAHWMAHKAHFETKARQWQINRSGVLLGLWLGTFAAGGYTLWAYQHSFYPPQAPDFSGITATNPFLCGKVPASSDTYAGSEVFQSLTDQVAANPSKKTPEYGLLALATGEERWAQAFRESLLEEARTMLFTGPSGSVKYGQYLAGKRAYFYPRVRDAFPELFRPNDEKTITDWFAAINQRTLTTEWVDWMYALALRYRPQGPYENQENGAGLLALLEINHLADPHLSTQKPPIPVS